MLARALARLRMYLAYTPTDYARARARIMKEPLLWEHAETLLYGHRVARRHWHRVASAPAHELINWADWQHADAHSPAEED